MSTEETLYSFVNPWECDENNHLNVQFYFSRFEEAERQFQLISGLSETLVGARRVRHVRYHKELRAGDLLTVRTSIAFDGPHMFSVVHEMYQTTTGDIVATAVDGYEPNANAVKMLRTRFKDFQCSMIDIAAPRGIPATPQTSRVSKETLEQGGAKTTFRGTVLQRHIGIDGRADDGFALACFSEGISHLWEDTPLNHAYMAQNNHGRVAVEMKLCWAGPLKAGDTVLVYSAITGCNNKTLSLRHHLFESRTGRIAAIMDVVSLVMDLTTRKAVEISPSNVTEISNLRKSA